MDQVRQAGGPRISVRTPTCKALRDDLRGRPYRQGPGYHRIEQLYRIWIAGEPRVKCRIKSRADYEFGIAKFNELWAKSVDVTKDYVTTIELKSPFAQFTPYELYLKFLYE